ncbi:hypothetical protein BGZ60DRAFT_433461 [Tricladium varicosporioides]|nr:hypothetical protein BGZ60DRAFT_433461 [Hymenoscyphus varicosporioides]
MRPSQAHVTSKVLQGKWTANIEGVALQVLDLPPSCVEFVPLKGIQEASNPRPPVARDQYFVVGTYDLQKEQDPVEVDVEDVSELQSTPKLQTRMGSLNLFRVRGDRELELMDRISCPSAILDLHFLPDRPTVFAIAGSTGDISLFKFVSKEPNASTGEVGNFKLEFIQTHQVFNPDLLVLSFCWYPGPYHLDYPLLLATLSDGGLYFVSFDSSLQNFRTFWDGEPLWKHTDQAWCYCLEEGIRNFREKLTDDMSYVTHLGRPHTAGVTAILFLPLAPYLTLKQDHDPHNNLPSFFFLTGSYDDHVRLFVSEPNPNRPARLLTSLNIGGGGWRLKFLQDYSVEEHPRSGMKLLVLASCMFAGAKILELEGGEYDPDQPEAQTWTIKIVASMNVHQSMCYACDVQPWDPKVEGNITYCNNQPGVNEKRLVVSTSFYDRLICLWNFDPSLPQSIEPIEHPTREPYGATEISPEASKSSTDVGVRIEELSP